MPVERIAQDSRLQARYQVGMSDEGEPVYRTRALARVKSDSDDQSLWTVASAISGLQKYQIAEVRRIDSSVLTEIV